MVSYLGRIAALAAVVIPAVFAAPAPVHLKIRNVEERDVVKDSYIVVYNKQVNASVFESHIAEMRTSLSKRGLTGIGATYDIGNFKGYQVTADVAALAEIAASPDVSPPSYVLYARSDIPRSPTSRRTLKCTPQL